MVKRGNKVSSWFCIKSGIKQGFVLPLFIFIILMNFALRSRAKTNGEQGISWESLRLRFFR